MVMISERIYFDIDDAQIANKSKDIAKLQEQVMQINVELDNHKRKAKAEISSLDAAIDEIWAEVRNEQESRVVECDATLEGSFLVLRYGDEVVKERPATPGEIEMFQTPLMTAID